MAKRSTLGAKQQEILAVIQSSIKQRGYPPVCERSVKQWV